MTVFVTVGTTEFDDLIRQMTAPEILSILKEKGYTKLQLQIGRGKFIPQCRNYPMELTYFMFKESLNENLKEASLIVSHAGAGSSMEALSFAKPVILVINTSLMGNHQLELAEKLQDDGHAFCCTCDMLPKLLQEANFEKLTPLPPAEPQNFANFVNNLMGIHT